MYINIREALSSEIAALLNFEKEIIAFERQFDDSLKNGEIHYYDLLALIKSDHASVLVAELNGDIIASGYAKIVAAENYLKFDEYAHLGFMYVKPEFRGQGINKKILDNLLEWAKSKNMNELRLQVYDENAAAIKAYAKAGFKPNMLEMRMEI